MGSSTPRSTSTGGSRDSTIIHELDQIVPQLPHHSTAPSHRREDTNATISSADTSFKADDGLIEEGLGTVDGVGGTEGFSASPRRSRRERSASWVKKWTRQQPGNEGNAEGGEGAQSTSQRKGIVLSSVGPWQQRFDDYLTRLHERNPRIGRSLLWLRGPSPAHIETQFLPFPLPILGSLFLRFERTSTSFLAPMQRHRRVTTPLYFLAWLLAFTFLVRASFFDSSSSSTDSQPSWVVSTSTFWTRNDGCGVNGTECEPFEGWNYSFRCPGQTLATKLLNYRTIGSTEVIFQPLVVGGMDAEGTYRSDSWICAAAIHRGLFGNQRGGCGELEFVGEFTGYEGGKRNGVDSVGFPSTFPSSWRFVEGVEQENCKDLRNDILGFNVAMTVIFSFFISGSRPAPQAFFWGLFVFGYWHVVLVSSPSAMPPDISTGFKYFLPALFVAESFWRHCWRFVVPAFENSGFILERTVWYLVGFWIGLLNNVSLGWIPISRLTPQDIKKEPGGLVAVICLAAFLFFAVLNQIRVIRRTGWFFFYLKWYAVGGIVLGILTSLPGLQFRLHHYFAAICLMPGTAFVTRPSAIFQGFLLSLFLEGVGRWGFDSILETPASLIGDGVLGTSIPEFLTNSTNFLREGGVVAWKSIEEAGVGAEGWDAVELLVDDVLVMSGQATNYSIAALNASIPHFFRLAYSQSGTAGDFTKAATAWIINSTWIDPAPGAT
ncbi:uncharacterized protein JCM6883_004458 [Sporobolomyces salmoneus]|uniref:uncharacterized protein n=1 Tax=Sporobolomyces salmoneus TaxID=183962 RepID=UPI00317ED0A5